MRWLTLATLASAACSVPLPVLWYDLSAVVEAEALSYEEQLLVYVFEGLVNRPTGPPRLMLDGACEVLQLCNHF